MLRSQVDDELGQGLVGKAQVVVQLGADLGDKPDTLELAEVAAHDCFPTYTRVCASAGTLRRAARLRGSMERAGCRRSRTFHHALKTFCHLSICAWPPSGHGIRFGSSSLDESALKSRAPRRSQQRDAQGLVKALFEEMMRDLDLNESMDGVELRDVGVRDSSPIGMINEDDDEYDDQQQQRQQRQQHSQPQKPEGGDKRGFRPFSDSLMATYLQEMYDTLARREAREQAFSHFLPSEGTVPRERYSSTKAYMQGLGDDQEDPGFVSEIDESEYVDTEVVTENIIH